MVIREYEDLVYDLTHSVGHLIVTLPYEATFNFEYKDLSEFYEEYVYPARQLSLYERPAECPMPKVTKEQRNEIYEKERYEREMIINDLKFVTHIMMNKYNEPAESRRFVATNDSCLSFVQVTVTPDCYRWSFVSRSTEVNKMLPADLCSIGEIIHIWTNWFMAYKPEHVTDIKRGIRISFMLNNPHYYK
jgi:hypothetical protein